MMGGRHCDNYSMQIILLLLTILYMQVACLCGKLFGTRLELDAAQWMLWDVGKLLQSHDGS